MTMSASDIEVILYRLGELDKKIEEVRADQRAVAARGICPSPGACIILQRDLDSSKANGMAFDSRLRALETLRAEARGAGIIAKGLWAFIGAGGIGVCYAIFELLHKG